MRNSLTFLSVLSVVYVASQYFDRHQILEVEIDQIVTTSTANFHTPEIWKLSLLNNPRKCSVTFMPDAKYVIALQTTSRCESIATLSNQIKMMKINATGDVELMSDNGAKIAEFSESESTHLESIFPKHPLMSLVRID